MSNAELRDVVNEISQRMRRTDSYINLCNRFNDWDHGMNLKGSDVKPVIPLYDPELKYAGSDGMFYKDYSFGEHSVRFMVHYKAGLIELTYLIWSPGNRQVRLYPSFRDLFGLNGENESKVKYKCPIATSVDDLHAILKVVFPYHLEFIGELEGAITK